MRLCLGKGQVADGQMGQGQPCCSCLGASMERPPAGPHNGSWFITPVFLAPASASLASDVSVTCQACIYPRALALTGPIIWDASPRMSSLFTPLPSVSQVCLNASYLEGLTQLPY